MSTTTLAGLRAVLAQLKLGSIPPFRDSKVLVRPIDVYRAYLAADLHRLLKNFDVGPDAAYDCIQLSSGLENGDMDVVLRRLRLAGVDADALAIELVRQFPPNPLFVVPFQDGFHIRTLFAPATIAPLLLPYILERGRSYGTDPSLGAVSITGSAPLMTGAAAARRTRPGRAMVHIPLPDLGLDFTASELRTAFLGKHIANLHAANGWHVIRAASSQSSDRGEHLGNLGAAWQGGLWPGDGVNDGVDAEFPARAALNHVRTIDARMLQLSRQRGTAFSLQTAAGSDGNNHFLRGRGFLQESDAFAKRMEDGDEQALGFIGRLQDLWFAECARHYKRLGIEFDTYIGHASGIPNMTKRLERPLAARGIAFQRDDGTTILDFDAHPAPTTPTTNAQGMAAASRTDKQPSKLGVHILRNASGTTTQLLRDAAAVLALVEEYDLDKLIMVTGADTGGTTQHYQRVSRTLTLAGHGEVAEKLVHVPCGVPTVGVPGLETTGSSGIGTSVTPTGSGGGGGLDDLPDIVTAEVLEPLEMMRGAYCIDYNTVEAEGDGSPAEILATAALAVSELTPRRGGSVRGQTQVFNLEALASLDGEDSGPALQLVYSRLRRRLALLSLTTATNYHVPGPHEDDFDDDDADAILRPVLCSKAALAELRTTPWVDLLRLLARYPDVVIGAKGTGDPSVYDTFEPCLLLQFLFRVVGDVREVLDEADDVDAGLGGEANGFTVIGGSGRGESSSAGSARGEREAAVRAVLEAVRVVIENGCELLGVPLIEVEAVRAARERQAVGKRVEREQ